MKNNILLLFLLSCATEEQIRQQKLVDQLTLDMDKSQKGISQSRELSAQIAERLEDYDQRIRQFEGKMEESFHSREEVEKEKYATLEAKIEKLEKDREELKTLLMDEIHKNRKIIKDQKKYISRVNTTLTKIDQGESFTSGQNLFKKKKYKEAATFYVKALGENPSRRQKDMIIHNLGLIHYYLKDYDKSLVYFSKIYPQKKKSRYFKNSLLYIGKNLIRMKKNPEAKEALSTLIKQHPKSWHAKMAKKDLKRIPQ